MKGVDRILELCRNEVSAISATSAPASVQEEQLLSPILKYLAAYSSNPHLCTETQISRRLSIPRPTVSRIMQTLEGYHVVQPIADFGTVKPYELMDMRTAFKAGWIRLQPAEVLLLFGVRDSKTSHHGAGGSRTYMIRGEDGSARWLPPMEAATSFFLALRDDLDLQPAMTLVTLKPSVEQVDAVFLGKLIEGAVFWPLTLSDLLLMEDKKIDRITVEDLAQTRRKLAEKYCWIYYQIAEKMISQDRPVREECLSFMSEILKSCIQVATAFGANGQLPTGRKLLDKISAELEKCRHLGL